MFWARRCLVSLCWAGLARAVPQAAHCFVNGPNVAGHGIPFGIIFGGTDLNEDVNQGEKHQVMGKVLGEARYSRQHFEALKI